MNCSRRWPGPRAGPARPSSYNASADRDESRRIAERHGARFVGLDRNAGYGGGVNAGVHAADDLGDYVLVCNSDLSFSPGAIDALVGFADAHPEVGSVGPAILNPDGTVYPSARRSPFSARGRRARPARRDRPAQPVVAPLSRGGRRYRSSP